MASSQRGLPCGGLAWVGFRGPGLLLPPPPSWTSGLCLQRPGGQAIEGLCPRKTLLETYGLGEQGSRALIKACPSPHRGIGKEEPGDPSHLSPLDPEITGNVWLVEHNPLC